MVTPAQRDEDLPPIPSIVGPDGRFWRHRRISARHVEAELRGGRLGDAGIRDLLMRGIEVCVPGASLLPLGIDRLHSAGASLSGDLRYSATEAHRDGDVHTFDITVRAPGGEVVERWEGLRVRAVGGGDGHGPWTVPLLGAHLERRIEDLTGARIAAVVEPHAGGTAGAAARRARTALAAARAVGHPVELRYRPDGRPELPGGAAVSASHGPGSTLCVVADGPVSCDVEAVAARPAEVWQALLGRRRRIAELAAEGAFGAGAEPFDVAATRVWSAVECLRKAGQPVDAPLTPTPGRGAWTVFASGALRIATLATRLRNVPDPVVLAVLVRGRS